MHRKKARGIRNREIEFKYNANIISKADFVSLCNKDLKLRSYDLVVGEDRFYGIASQPNTFFRHRISDDGMNQLTLKRKLVDANNFIRIEHNVDLLEAMSTEKIEDFCKELGFTYNFSLIKEAVIFKTEYYTVVYYTCFDLSNKKLGSFIEIEMAEDVSWTSEIAAFKELCTLEKKFKKLGVGPNQRVKKSLWELYKNDNNS